jgi:hypothetical protein
MQTRAAARLFSTKLQLAISVVCNDGALSLHFLKEVSGRFVEFTQVNRRAPGHRPGDTSSEDHTQNHPEGLYTTGRTPCGDKPERTTPPRSPFGARMQWPEPAYTEQSQARCAPDEGRCRADPHCTHDGGGRHIDSDLVFHAVQQ